MRPPRATGSRAGRRPGRVRPRPRASAAAHAARVSPDQPTSPDGRRRRATGTTTTTASTPGRARRRHEPVDVGPRRDLVDDHRHDAVSRRRAQPVPERGRRQADRRVPVRSAAAGELGEGIDDRRAVGRDADTGQRRVLGVREHGPARARETRDRRPGEPAAEHELEAIEAVRRPRTTRGRRREHRRVRRLGLGAHTMSASCSGRRSSADWRLGISGRTQAGHRHGRDPLDAAPDDAPADERERNGAPARWRTRPGPARRGASGWRPGAGSRGRGG